jgi:hypothetical protein
MSIRPGAPGLKRHWFVAISAVVCFVTSLALLFSAFYRPTTVDFKEPIQWVYTWMWSLLELFPNPATLGAMVAFFRPWRELQHTHAAVALASNALLFLFSLALGWSLWQRHSWARTALATLCVLKIPVVLGNIAVYGQQFTYCADGSIYPCSKSLAARLLPYCGFPIAGIVVSIAAFAFLWRYGLEPPGYSGVHTTPFPKSPDSGTADFTEIMDRRVDGMLTASRWIVVTLSLVIAADYSYHLWGWLPLVLPRFAGGEFALGIRTLMPLIFLAIASYVIAAAQLIRRVGVLQFALICGTALACLLAPFLGIGAQGTLGVPFLLGIGVWPTLPMIWLLDVATYLFLTVFAIVGLWRISRDHTSSDGSLGAGIIVPLIFVLAWPQAQTNFKNYSTFSRFPKATSEKKAANDRQTTAWKLVRIYGRCAFLYRQTHPGQGFPAEASAMGPGNGGEGCLTTAQVTGKIEGYQAHYEAGPADSSGVVTRFHVFVLKSEPTADDLGYFLDESGITTGLTKQSTPIDAAGNHADSQPAADAPLRRNGTLFTALPFRLRGIHDCLAQIRDVDPAKQFPITAEPLLDKVNPYGYPCISVYDRTQSSQSDFRSNSFVVALNSLDSWNVQLPEPRYRLHYTVRPDSTGARGGYMLTAQPVNYNEDGVRSYLIDERGSLRATSDNRLAIGSDPEVPKCEDYPRIQCLDLIPSFSPNSSGATSKLVP